MAISSELIGKLMSGSDVFQTSAYYTNASGSSRSHTVYSFVVPPGRMALAGFFGSSTAGNSNEAELWIGSDPSGWTMGTWIYGSGTCSVARYCEPGSYIVDLFTLGRNSVSVDGTFMYLEV